MAELDRASSPLLIRGTLAGLPFLFTNADLFPFKPQRNELFDTVAGRGKPLHGHYKWLGTLLSPPFYLSLKSTVLFIVQTARQQTCFGVRNGHKNRSEIRRFSPALSFAHCPLFSPAPYWKG